jgi:multimeric flavodoxin WrbA
MKVVAFNGSSRSDGNTAILIRHVFAELEAEGIETELVQLAGEEIPGCVDCGICLRTKDGHCGQYDDVVNDCIDRMVEADGIIIGSPVYFADCTAAARALIERAGYASRRGGDRLARKVGAAVIAVRRGGAIHAFDSVNHFFQIAGMVVIGSSYWNIGIGREAGDVENDAEGIATMKDLGRNMAWALNKLNA